MKYPLIIAGQEIERDAFRGISPFYPGYTYELNRAGPLDIAQAIGAARRADRPRLPERFFALQRAAQAFSYQPTDIEHAVRMTGMPIRLVSEAFAEIRHILHSVPEQFKERFSQAGGSQPQLAEAIGHRRVQLLSPKEGFCYALTPGNDIRGAAIVAANLGCLGIPFILRASIRDAAAPLIVRALIDGGFDPRFANLIYIDRDDPLADAIHFQLAQACRIIWTFGPVASNERFEDRQVVRHTAGNCAAIVRGSFNERMGWLIYASSGYAIACTATRSVMIIDGGNWDQQAADYLAGLKIGDPLDPETEVGYIDPRCLDYLENLRQKNRLRIHAYGGERYSPIQAAPLLVSSQGPAPDFFGQEIPAYVLAVQHCPDLSTAVARLNAYTGETVRLAVSFINIPREQLVEALQGIRAHAAMVDKPTTTLLPALHEGNDYARLLTRSQLVVW